MKKLLARSASAYLLVLLSYATAAAQADQTLPAVGGSGGNDFYSRCPSGQHLLGFNLRAGHNIDAIQPICGVPASETQVQVRDEMPRYGGTGGNPAQVICPSQATAAAPKPVVLGLGVLAEGIDGKVLNNIWLRCGIVAAHQRIPLPTEEFDARYDAPDQELPSGSMIDTIKRRSGASLCPPGLLGVGVYGRAGAAVNSLGLICGAAQTGFTAGRTLGKRKRPQDQTAGRTIERWSAGKKWRPGAGAETSSAAAQGALAAARASVDPAIYDQYVGRYLENYTVSREADRLYLARPDKKLELIPQSETDFSLHSTESIVRFNKNREGRVVSLSIMFADVESTHWREGYQPLPKSPF